MQSTITGNWGIELKGDELDLAAWKILLKQPFDPYVKEIFDERGDYLVLFSSNFEGMRGPSEVYSAAKPLLCTLNVAMAKNADADAVSCRAIVEFVHNSPPRKHHVLEALPATLKIRPGIIQLAVTDANGNVIKSKLAPSRPQEWMRAAALVPDIGAALRYLEGKPNWVELYKAYEALKPMPSGGLPEAEIKRFTQTANTAHRHHPNQKKKPHSCPMELWEARTLITQWVSAAIEDVLLKNPLPPVSGPT
ncbi:MAG: hypothetical protein KJ981_20185 [Alphaproteobacteria bacterium]|nr:hypothetical protein [Alphaproteobacteria bacterium]MBU0831739.1 hypothetical protein [Alphaproteobacteria bacterium]MBU1766206.1 hypothetical protein [Alphaproteobacteria bacterium]